MSRTTRTRRKSYSPIFATPPFVVRRTGHLVVMLKQINGYANDMDADSFTIELAKLAQPISYWREQGLSVDLAQEFYSSYICHFIEGRTRQNQDPLLDLLHRYDTSTLCIHMIRFDPDSLAFFSSLLPNDDRIPVAEIEEDPLVLDKRTGEILQLDHATIDYVMARWARESGLFLDALLLVAKFDPPNPRRSYSEPDLADREKAENNEAAKAWAAQCALAAGLEPSESRVYEMLLWTY